MREQRGGCVITLVAIFLACVLYATLAFLGAARPAEACEAVPITPNTPTGIAGCEAWGEGIASHYGPGDGVAMNFCTWTVRHSTGCGAVEITNLETGTVVIASVIDYCDCFLGTADQRLVDLQHGVVHRLGFDLSRGLYPVRVEPVREAVGPIATPMLPNTAMR